MVQFLPYDDSQFQSMPFFEKQSFNSQMVIEIIRIEQIGEVVVEGLRIIEGILIEMLIDGTALEIFQIEIGGVMDGIGTIRLEIILLGIII